MIASSRQNSRMYTHTAENVLNTVHTAENVLNTVHTAENVWNTVHTAENVPSGFKMFICKLLSYILNFQKMPPREFWANHVLRNCRNQVHS